MKDIEPKANRLGRKTLVQKDEDNGVLGKLLPNIWRKTKTKTKTKTKQAAGWRRQSPSVWLVSQRHFLQTAADQCTDIFESIYRISTYLMRAAHVLLQRIVTELSVRETSEVRTQNCFLFYLLNIIQHLWTQHVLYRVSAALRVQNSRSNQGVSKESNGCFQGVLFASAFNLFEEFSSSC